MTSLKRLTLSLLLLAVSLSQAAPPAPLQFPTEQAALTALATHFSNPLSVKSDTDKGTELTTHGLAGKPNSDASTITILVEKPSGHVVEITSNGAALNDENFAEFAKFPELRALVLWHNTGYTGDGLKSIATLPKLARVTLAGGSLDDVGLAALAKFPALKVLRAWHCKFTDTGIASLMGHPTLEEIQIGPNWEPTLTDKSLVALAQCPKLKKLSFDESYLTWEGGLQYLAKHADSLTDLTFGKSLIAPADIDRLKAAMPKTKIVWNGLAAAAADLAKPAVRSKAEKWIPKTLIDQALAASPATAASSTPSAARPGASK